MQQLIQQKGFHYRAYVLREDDVLVHIRDFQQEREFSVDYLDLGLQFYRKTEYRFRFLGWITAGTFALMVLAMIGVSTGILSFEMFYPITLGTMAGTLWVWTKLRQDPPIMYLVGGDQQLSFLADYPSAEALHDFVQALTVRIKEAYESQYLNEQAELPAEERRSRIQWLHQMKVLTRTEKDILLAELGPIRQKAIGFKRTA